MSDKSNNNNNVINMNTNRISFSEFMKSGFGGALGCCFTHVIVVPMDVVKTRLQTDPIKYNSGMRGTMNTIIKEEGSMMLLQGLGATTFGYAIQGFFKFGLYDAFKRELSSFFGKDTYERYRIPIWVAASATAEVIGDIALCPFEATRIRQVSDPKFGSSFISAITRIHKEEGWNGLYKGLTPIILKQVPYTCSQFVTYELANSYLYKYLGEKKNIRKNDLSKTERMGIILGTGAISGVVASVVSHPADTILSKINQEKTDGGTGRAIANIVKRLGVRGLFLGVEARCVMVTTLVTVQFMIYDGIKLLMS